VVSERVDERPEGSTLTRSRADSHRLLADVYHQFLSEQSLGAVLERIADALADLVPHDTLTIYEAHEAEGTLMAALSRDRWEEEILAAPLPFGVGITGWAVANREAVLSNQAHLDPRVSFVPGTPIEPESLISVPLIARGTVKGALNIYRQGEATFSEDEFELTKNFADAAALAIDNAHIRDALEYQAHTDSLTGLYNHRLFHERLRSEINRASRSKDSVALVMFDIDDFKKLNDVYGHGVGDQVLITLADILRATVRSSDVACRVGGEEFAVILPSCDAGDGLGLARRLRDRLAVMDFDPAGPVTISIGIAQGPLHAMNPRELVGCAEAAMMTAKARGKNRSVVFSEGDSERPDAAATRDDVRSLAHMKMLQSLAGKLNRMNEVKHIADAIANELRTLIDYHSCRVYVAEDEDLIPIAVRGDLSIYKGEVAQLLATKFGEGITGRAGSTGQPVLVPNSLECEFAVKVPGTSEIEESLIAVPMLYGARVNGVISISKLGRDQFDEDDVRLMEVLAGQASVALENARLYETQRREAENARALLQFADHIRHSLSVREISNLAVDQISTILGVPLATMWLLDEADGKYRCVSHHGYVGDPQAQAFVRRVIEPDEAEGLLSRGHLPFVMTPEEMRDRFDALPDFPLQPVAVAPLLGGSVRGWLVARQAPGPGAFFTEQLLRLFQAIGSQVTVSLQKAMLYRDQKDAADIASALLDLTAELSSAENWDQVLQRVVERAAGILGSPQASLWLQESETGDLVPEAWCGLSEEQRADQVFTRVPAHVAERFLLDAPKSFVVRPEDYASLLSKDFKPSGLTYAVAPLRLEGRLGCIIVAAPALGDYQFSERKMRLLAGIADHAKLALNNAHSFDVLESTFVSTIEALANALEAKDEYTSNHARSIVDMSLEVGLEMGLDPSTLKRLEMGALFHDIGKIGIPSDILLKPGPLTDEEREVMNTHPELGERILAPIERLSDVRPIVRACHEHYDGSGYPDRKSGDEIPIEARIILVCDAFDAMTTDRPYRKRLPSEEAIKRIRMSSGSQFDPEIVEAFLETVRRA
jgi:diguanylate cyclase (GGDEF)-like protein